MVVRSTPIDVIKAKPLLSYQSKKKKKREGEGVNELVLRKFSVERLRMALARMIIFDELPFGLLSMAGSLILWQR